MKIIINTSNLSGTGVVQVAVSFINECIKFHKHTYYVFLSLKVAEQIDINKFPDNFHFFKIENHPFYGIQGLISRNYLKSLEKKIIPDVVFTVFGPSYWKPLVPHLIGYAYPHYVYPESPVFKKLNFRELITTKVMKILHRYYFLRDGRHYVCETPDVSHRLATYLSISHDHIYTVSNTANSFFEKFVPQISNILPFKEKNEFRFLSLCSFAKHKNLEILNHVVPLLKEKCIGVDVKFILTIDEKLFIKSFSDEAKLSIINLGRVDINICPQLYYECDALFLPTLLECFTANYVEAMIMKKPIITSNLSFAKNLCQDAALYFDPISPQSITDTIVFLIKEEEERNRLIQNGADRLILFETAESRANKYMSILNKISQKNEQTY